MMSKIDELNDLAGLEGQEARTFGAQGFPRVYFVSKHADYEDTPLEQGGFFVDAGDDRVKMDGWGAAFDIKRDSGSQSVRAARTLPCAIMGITQSVRRMIVYSMQDAQKAIGHIDIAPKVWRDELGGDSGKYAKAAPHSSIYLVPQAQPDQVFEMKVKGGNVVAASAIIRQVYDATVMLSEAAGRTKANPLNDHALWHTLAAGPWLKYPERVNEQTGQKESGGRTHLCLSWPMIENHREFLRKFVTVDAWGQKIDSVAEFRAVRELLTRDVLGEMWVGRSEYERMGEMRRELDRHLSQNFRVCGSEAEVRGELERIYSESMGRRNAALGGAGSTGGAPAQRGTSSTATAPVVERAAVVLGYDSYEAMLTSFRTDFVADASKVNMPALAAKINGQLDARGLSNRAEATFKSIVNCLKILRDHAEINDPQSEAVGAAVGGSVSGDEEIDF